MAHTIPLRYAQSLLRLVPIGEQQLRRELLELKLPLVLLQDNAVADASIAVDDYGRLFIHLIHKLQQDLPSRSGDVERTLVSPENFNMEQLNWLPGLTGQLLSMAMWHRVCCWFIGSFIDLSAVEMKQPARPNRDYRDVFGKAVQFASKRDSFFSTVAICSFPSCRVRPP